MKKLILWGVLLTLSFVITGCDVSTTTPTEGDNTTSSVTNASTTLTTTSASQSNADVDQLKALLVAAGYELDERDAESVAYYNENAVNAKYTISVTVTEVYLGYVNQVERWAELIGFESELNALAFTNAIEEKDTTGLLFYQVGSAVIITYSQDTITALP